METVTVKRSEVEAAIARVTQLSDEWQAGCCEVARIPAVQARWRELNPNLTGLEVEFHPGLPYERHTPEQNQAIGENRLWSMYVGWTLKLFDLEGGVGSRYNTVRADWYSHGPSVCWDGMRRSTKCQFIYALTCAGCGYITGHEDVLADAHVEYDPTE